MTYWTQIVISRRELGELCEKRKDHFSGVYASLERARSEGMSFLQERLRELYERSSYIRCEFSFDEFCAEDIKVWFLVTEMDPELSDHYESEEEKWVRPARGMKIPFGTTGFEGMCPSHIEWRYDRHGILQQRMVCFGHIAFEMYTEDTLPDAGLRFQTGDLVSVSGDAYVVESTPRREERPNATIWENFYTIGRIDAYGNFLWHNHVHELQMEHFEGEISEPLRALSLLFRGDISIDDAMWKKLYEGEIDFSERQSWKQVFLASENVAAMREGAGG